MKQSEASRVPLIAGLVTLAALSFVSAAVIITYGQEEPQVIYAAVNTSDGTLRILPGTDSRLRKNEYLLGWNQMGPVGPQGIQGEPGPPGPPGPGGTALGGSVFRWNVFDTFDDAAMQWLAGNDPSLFGGVYPWTWTDQDGTAEQISADKDVQRALFARKGYGGRGALVYAEVFQQVSSTSGRVVVCLFRIRNTTAEEICWNARFLYTAHVAWNERASVAINGTDVFVSPGGAGTQTADVSLPIPPSRTSTVVFVSMSSAPRSLSSLVYLRQVFMGFSNDTLQLPPGLEYVDDLDSATGGWEQ